jgi:hypothetical protein
MDEIKVSNEWLAAVGLNLMCNVFVLASKAQHFTIDNLERVKVQLV